MNEESEPHPDNGRSFHIAAVGVLLISLWFVPDLIGRTVVWSFQSVSQIEGGPLIALLTPPLAGALLLLLFAVNGASKVFHIGAFLVGCGAAVTLLLFGRPAFFIGPYVCIAVAAVTLGIAVVARLHRRPKMYFYSAVALLPAALLGYALWGIADGRYPAAYLLPLKLPVALFAAQFVAGISAQRLRRP